MAPRLALVLALVTCGPAAATETPPPSQGLVLLELFTSQGCSSCPAADRLLSALGQAGDTGGRVVPLAFHVDYWNREGWVDPFGDAAWSARQEAYARAFGLQGVYTPQLVIDGEAHQNGGDARRAVAALEARHAREVAASVVLAGAGLDAAGAWVEVSAAWRRPPTGPAELLVALFENGLVTRVRRGENRGQTLRDDYVVRGLERVLVLPAEPEARGERRLRLPLRPGWRREQLGVAVFLQDPASLRVHAAAARMLQEAP
jgi:hypothetical protein